MTDYWVSTKKHYCETCNCWLSGHRVNIKNHEKSARHIENLKKVISESFKRKEQETKEKEFLERELKKLENVERKVLSDLNKNGTSPHRSGDISLNVSNAHSKSRSGNQSSSNNEGVNTSSTSPSSNPASRKNKKWVPMIHEDTRSLVFFNRLKNEIVHEKPKDFFEDFPEHESFVEQNGWYKYFDYNSNSFYYFNIYSSKSVWEYSLSRINSLMDFINRCEQAAQKNISSGNPAEVASLSMHAGSVASQHHLHLGGPPYYVNYSQMFTPQSYSVYATNNPLSNPAGTAPQMVESTKEGMIQQSSDNGDGNIPVCDGSRVHSSTHYGKVHDASPAKLADRVGENGGRIAKETDAQEGSNAMEEGNPKENPPYEMSERGFKESSTHFEGKKKKANISLSFKKAEGVGTPPHGRKENEKSNMGGGDQLVESSTAQQDESAKPGMWEVVENNDVETISNEHIEQIFYNVKSKEEIEKEKIAQLEEDIRYEYSEYNEFYIKKKELENEEIYLNQEFKFVDKPIYKKAIDKNRDKKVDFAKRSIKGMKNKKKIS
ncbi:U1 small nuclear ribonucleoprotein C, putative [Plasmodium vivax]|uniref:U1 small nuclear ribonucleoprotein C, putative n=1 Tax=Plasmodium vivax TaxID=5855 RepID=A0A1G4H3Y6_PLAVI|nr:U1 small nuclear ribonucleoprotein C, putative [Plasmodium vivax]